MLALVALIMFAVPVLAEEPYETIPYVYSSSGGSEHFSFYSMFQDSLENAWVAGDGCRFFKLFAKNRSGLRIKDIELRYVKGDFAHAAISCGKKVDPGKTYQRGDWLRINDIHSSSVSFTSLDSYCNGTDVIVYYEASGIGSTVSEGNGMIVVAVGVVVIAAAAVIIVNKRKKAKASS